MAIEQDETTKKSSDHRETCFADLDGHAEFGINLLKAYRLGCLSVLEAAAAIPDDQLIYKDCSSDTESVVVAEVPKALVQLLVLSQQKSAELGNLMVKQALEGKDPFDEKLRALQDEVDFIAYLSLMETKRFLGSIGDKQYKIRGDYKVVIDPSPVNMDSVRNFRDALKEIMDKDGSLAIHDSPPKQDE